MSGAAVVFTASVAFILYVLIGYPLLLAIYARLFPQTDPKGVRASELVGHRSGSQWSSLGRGKNPLSCSLRTIRLT